MVSSCQIHKALSIMVVLALSAGTGWASTPSETYANLQNQQKQLKGTPKEHEILIQMSDLLWDSSSWGNLGLSEEEELDMGVQYLKKIVNGDIYSPLIVDAWVKWRMRHQLYWHGASNQSTIPNDMYNDRRKHLVVLIDRHLKDHPENQIAKGQLLVLTHTHDIVPMAVGNTAVAEWELSKATLDKP